MKKIICNIAFLLILLAYGGCVNERIDDPKNEEECLDCEAPLSFVIPLFKDAASIPEQTMIALRVIIFQSNAGGIDGVLLFNDKIDVPGGATEIEIDRVVPSGYLNIYLIANETAAMNLGAITAPASALLNTIRLDYSTTAGNDYLSPTHFPMYEEYKRVVVDPNGVISHEKVKVVGGKTILEIDRAIAKLTVNIACDFADISNNKIALEDITLINMPLTPFLVPNKQYDSANPVDYFSSSTLTFGPAVPADSVLVTPRPGNTGFDTDTITYYIPEHRINNNHDNFTHLFIKACLANNPSIKFDYTVPICQGLGDGTGGTYTVDSIKNNLGTIPNDALSVFRNTHYNFDLKIKGLGSLKAIEVSATVRPWDSIWIDGTDRKPYLNVSTVATTVNGFISQRIYFWTNQPDSLVYLDETGKVATTAGVDFTVNDIFNDVAGLDVSNFYFNPATGSGYFDLILLPSGSALPPTRYLIYLRASELLREIEVNASYTLPGTFSGWLYVKKGSTGLGMSWDDAAPTISGTVAMADNMIASGYTVKGVLVAGGSGRTYGESFTIPAGVKVYGGWEGTSGSELAPSDEVYTTAIRNLSSYKAVVSPGGGQVTVTGTDAMFDGFLVQNATGASAVSVIDTAYINAVEISRNNPSGTNALTVDNATAVNVLVSNNTQGIAVSNAGKLINATIVNNTGAASTLQDADMLNCVVWGNSVAAFTLSGTNTIAYCAFPDGAVPAGTGNVHLHASGNTQWFTTTNGAPGPHFNMTAAAKPYYSALSNRSPMLGRGDEDSFNDNTPFMPSMARTDINGNDRHYLGTDMGCYEDPVYEGFKFEWASDRLYITSKAGSNSECLLVLLNNDIYMAGVAWTISNVTLNYCTFNGPSSGSGTGTSVGTIYFSPTVDYNGSVDRFCGTIFVSTNLGAYLPNSTIEIWQVPGLSVVWESGYVGSFHRNNETSERYITGENAYAKNGNGLANRAYYQYWSARIISGLDWIKIDTNPKGSFGGEVQETPGGVISGSGDLRFRVGMKSTLPPGAPPRYGLIVLSRGDVPGESEGSAWFFVRQGEEADYLFRPEDPRTGGRPDARKMANFYLRDPLDRYEAKDNVNGGLDLGTNGGAFTTHPSKIGYFFQRSRTVAYLRGVQTSNLPNNNEPYWNNEVCPPGYRHPTWSEFIMSVYGNVAVPEADGSVSPSGTEVRRNFIFGRYADGYYDQLAPDPVTYETSWLGEIPNVANGGILMVNYYNYASIFFPAAGHMTYNGVTSIPTISSGASMDYFTLGSGEPQVLIMIPTIGSNMGRQNTHWYTGHIGMACTALPASVAAAVKCVKIE